MKSAQQNLILIACSAVIAGAVVSEYVRESVTADWITHQEDYDAHLRAEGKEGFPVHLRQIIPTGAPVGDRCVSCHVALEDPGMAEAAQPLRAHPGDYLETHDVGQLGCTLCHDGQPHTIDFAASKSWEPSHHWERPVLPAPYIEARCARCHEGDVEGAPTLALGRRLFEGNGCLGCHRIGRSGGTLGPDLTAIGDASFHLYAPTEERHAELLERFRGNVNLAYLYESVRHPEAQPVESKMISYAWADDEAEALAVYLKSLSRERAPYELLAARPRSEPLTAVEEGERVFARYCGACHDPAGQGKDVIASLRKSGPAILSADFLSMVTREELDKLLVLGRESGLMPSWAEGMTSAEREHVLAFVEAHRAPQPDVAAIIARPDDLELGRFVFDDHCAVCHQAFESGSMAAPLNTREYVEKTTVEAYLAATLGGDLPKGMPSYAQLREDELASLLSLFREWKAGEGLLATDPGRLTGDPLVGDRLFEQWCSMCHGPAGIGGFAPQVGSKECLDVMGEGLIRATLAKGRSDSIMLSIDKITGARDLEKAAQQIVDLDAYLKSLQASPE